MDDRQAEAELMGRIGDGDAAAYRTLSDRYMPAIYRYATRLLRDATEAEDVTQDTFMQLWTSSASWRPDAKVSTWLHTITHNRCVDRLRRRATRNEVRTAASTADDGDTDVLANVASSDRTSDLMLRKQTATTVEGALGELPDRQRAAIVLVHYQGMSNPEAAEVLGIGVEAVESLLSRARRTLRDTLQSLHDDTGGQP